MRNHNKNIFNAKMALVTIGCLLSVQINAAPASSVVNKKPITSIHKPVAAESLDATDAKVDKADKAVNPTSQARYAVKNVAVEINPNIKKTANSIQIFHGINLAPNLVFNDVLVQQSNNAEVYQPNLENPFQQLLQDTRNNTSGSQLAENVMKFLGTRYRYGGTSPKEGFDCSGLIFYAAQKMGVSLPRTAAKMANIGGNIERSKLIPGDLVFFNTRGGRFSHVGVYLGSDKFVHSPRTGAVVRVERLSSSYWKKRYTGARRIANNKNQRIVTGSQKG